MDKLTSKERVLRALNHQEVDRVPLDLGGTACCLLDGIYFKLKDYLGIQGDIEPWRRGANACYYDERILERFDVDFRRVFAGQNPNYPIQNPDGTFTNEWGLVQREGTFGMEMVRHPLADAEIEDLETYPWPKASEMLIVDGMKQRAKKLWEENQYAISLRAPCNGIFEIACWLRGTQEFMIDMLSNEEFAAKLTEKIAQVQMDYYGYMLDEVGPYVDMVETGDDYGSQASLLLSPDCLREFILNHRKKLNQMIKQKAPQCKIFLHCCGSIKKIIPDLIACGVDVLNPVQTRANDMDPADLKSLFGDQICFHGGIDTQASMCGDQEQIEREVSHMLEAMGKNGGYILTSCNHIQDDVPPENVVAMFELAKKLSQK